MKTRPRLRALLFVLALGVAALVVLAGIAALGYRWFLMPTTDAGTCLVVDRNRCTELSAARIEAAADVVLAERVTVVDSESGRSAKAGSVFALVRLDGNDGLTLGDGYVDSEPARLPKRVSEYLRQRGIAVVSVSVDDARDASVYFGRDEDGRSWAYLNVVWNG